MFVFVVALKIILCEMLFKLADFNAMFNNQTSSKISKKIH